MRFEFSAGGIVLRKTQDFGSKSQFTKKKVEILLCQHSQHHGWVFPKGLIGDHIKGEGKEETALREVEEETGVIAKIIKPVTPTTYWYNWENDKVRKTVYYFIMEYIDGDITKHDAEMENVEWLAPEEVEKRLTYASDKKVWEETRKLIS